MAYYRELRTQSVCLTCGNFLTQDFQMRVNSLSAKLVIFTNVSVGHIYKRVVVKKFVEKALLGCFFGAFLDALASLRPMIKSD